MLRIKRSSSFELLLVGTGGDLLFRAVTSQVPSALKGLTSVFGMDTGDPLRLCHRKSLLSVLGCLGYTWRFAVRSAVCGLRSFSPQEDLLPRVRRSGFPLRCLAPGSYAVIFSRGTFPRLLFTVGQSRSLSLEASRPPGGASPPSGVHCVLTDSTC